MSIRSNTVIRWCSETDTRRATRALLNQSMKTTANRPPMLHEPTASEAAWRAPKEVRDTFGGPMGLTQKSIGDLILPIKGHSETKRRLLRGELKRFQESLKWIKPVVGTSLLDMGSCGDLTPVYCELLGFERVCCVDARNSDGPSRCVHPAGKTFGFESFGRDLEREPFPFDDGTFDQAVAMEVVEHLAVDPLFMLAEANRVLKLGGSLLLTTPNVTSASCVYNVLWSRHPSLGAQTYGPGIMDRHHREYAPRDVVEMVEAAGFSLRKLDTFDSTPPATTVRQVRRLMKVLRWIRPSIDLNHRHEVIRCVCVKTGGVKERFPEHLYPRYSYYDYAAYDRELTKRFSGRRYWRTSAVDAPRWDGPARS